MGSRALLLLFLLAHFALCACAGTHARREPAWVNSALASNRLSGLEPGLIDQAAADPEHIARIRAAVRAPDPSNPRAAEEASNLADLVIRLHHRHGNNPEYLALARHMYAVDPEHHGYTLAAIAERHPLEECEAEVLRIAFDPRITDSPAWRSSGTLAASTLVQRLALDAPGPTRDLPVGAPEPAIVDGGEIACYQWALRAAYGQGPPGEAAARVAAILDHPGSPHRPGNDHDVENCRTLIWRLTGDAGRAP